MIIDWMSFTLPVTLATNEQVARDNMNNAIAAACPAFAGWLYSQHAEQAASRRPYTFSYRYGKAQVFGGIGQTHCLIEASGQACEALRVDGMLDQLLRAEMARFTRIDVAIDIASVEPDDIIEAGYSSKFKAHTRIASSKGVTHYIGSPKSERYARVYRYAEPHPRAGLCRIEMVHRKRYARIIVERIINDGLTNAGLAALKSYQFAHDSIPTTGENVLQTVAIVKGDANTLRWIIAQCAPAFRRLVANGTIDSPTEFVDKYFLAKSETPPCL